MPDPTNRYSSARSRRDILKAGAVGGTALIAGCSGGGNGNTTGNGGGGGGGGGDDSRLTYFDPVGDPPGQRHFNPWNPSQTGCWHPGANVFDRLAIHSPATNEAFPIIANSWEMTDDTTLETELSDEWTWHNGDPVVAQDWAMQWEMEIAISTAGDGDNPTPMEEIEVVDDHFLRINLNTELSEIFAVQNTIGWYHGDIGRGIYTKHDDDQWSEWHDQLLNSEGDELDSVIEEITTSSYPNVEDAIGQGPFQVSEVGDDVILMEKYEDHPRADDINFDEFELWVSGDVGERVQPYANGIVDAVPGGYPVPESQRNQLPDTHSLYREARTANSLICFNCGHEVEGYDSAVSNENVRKAIAHIYDKQQTEGLLQGVKQLFDGPPCRIPGPTIEEGSHPSTEWIQDFPRYGQNDTERAAELLRQEGYEQDSGEWLNPDGERFELNILNPAEQEHLQVLIQNLEDFGIAVEAENVDDATMNERRQNGEYDIIPDGSSANGVFAMWSPGLIVDWISQLTNYEPEAEIPMPVGDPEGSSGTKTINIADHVEQWMATDDEEYHKELTWWWNQTLPEYEALYEPDAAALNTAHFEFDGVPDTIVDGVDDALYIAPKLEEGTLRYKE
ncbi:ABC transporter substrate-binding protein [Halopiger xanaduensis]|uniref:ABC-type transporter, periplasmic subunit n=1 Tax=Halopiger xanaduensis (strain DSM 18323 / JCM 14033 / SH-6) TaxID=797210 RepID=F8DD95_HALXS|nr:ABC transporter substrate-binding protein [Halopiger xanaduensis]AEH38984.1 ABC-type transporter, periplasmic subunit [Halopiger xanaduensis SH-6]